MFLTLKSSQLHFLRAKLLVKIYSITARKDLALFVFSLRLQKSCRPLDRSMPRVNHF